MAITKGESNPPRATKKPDDPEQSKRFIEAAKELGCDDSGEAFDRAFAQIVPPKVPERPKALDDAGE